MHLTLERPVFSFGNCSQRFQKVKQQCRQIPGADCTGVCYFPSDGFWVFEAADFLEVQAHEMVKVRPDGPIEFWCGRFRPETRKVSKAVQEVQNNKTDGERTVGSDQSKF